MERRSCGPAKFDRAVAQRTMTSRELSRRCACDRQRLFSEFFAQVAFVLDFCVKFYLFGEAVACFLTAARTLYSLADTIASRQADRPWSTGGMVVLPVVALQLPLQTNVSQLMAIDKDVLEIGAGEHACHAKTC